MIFYQFVTVKGNISEHLKLSLSVFWAGTEFWFLYCTRRKHLEWKLCCRKGSKNLFGFMTYKVCFLYQEGLLLYYFLRWRCNCHEYHVGHLAIIFSARYILIPCTDYRGWKAVSIHGDKPQNARTQALSLFKEGTCPLMVCWFLLKQYTNYCWVK